MPLCNCPVGSALTPWVLPTCIEDFGQIQKFLFQRIYSSGSTKNSFTVGDTDDITTLANLTTRLSAANGTLIIQSPFVEGIDFTPGDIITTGGGDDSLDGIEVVRGNDPSTFNGFLYEIPQSVAKKIKLLACEEIGVYLVNEYGQIGGIADDNESAGVFYPIPIPKRTFNLSDKGFGGKTGRDNNAIRFQFRPNWSDEFYIETPSDYNALDRLATS